MWYTKFDNKLRCCSVHHVIAWGPVKLRINITCVFGSCRNCPSPAATRGISATSENTSDIQSDAAVTEVVLRVGGRSATEGLLVQSSNLWIDSVASSFLVLFKNVSWLSGTLCLR